ncbi:hypothetical protein M7I_4768 [Glarea lozoyensis 74030]|uniref:Uncharacterized protein n=1 Tax=Glarea lozoyensis (strain ATCC 74030 / MF5533) TaxID=1104152 RepID=H0EQ25_GLAL7|nr:hypothetical protein M7I_4768 [Glarea lozoyensis 74030]
MDSVHKPRNDDDGEQWLQFPANAGTPECDEFHGQVEWGNKILQEVPGKETG